MTNSGCEMFCECWEVRAHSFLVSNQPPTQPLLSLYIFVTSLHFYVFEANFLRASVKLERKRRLLPPFNFRKKRRNIWTHLVLTLMRIESGCSTASLPPQGLVHCRAIARSPSLLSVLFLSYHLLHMALYFILF